MKNILFIGPVPPPIHGQSLVFYEAFKGIMCHNKFVVNQNVTGKSFLSTISLVLLAIFKIVFYLLFKKIGVVYFTCSRSKHGSLLDIIIIHLSKLFHAKIINHLHGADFKDFYESLTGVFKKIIYGSYMKVDVSIVLLEEMKAQFSPYFPKMRLEVVSNFYINTLEQIQTKVLSENIRILYLSNIMKSKGIIELLDAFSSLTEKYNNLSLMIAGDFMEDYIMSKKEIKQIFFERFERLKKIKKEKIHYVGVVSGNKKLELLQSSDIFVLPTYYRSEAFPLSIIEAMRAGNVIITTNHNYLPNIVSRKQGFLVDTGSAEAIERAVTFLVENKNRMRSIQEYNMRYARSTYSIEQHVKRLTTIFESV